MTQDPIDRLERELRAAVRQRRRQRLPRRIAPAVAIVVLSLSGGAVAVAQLEGKSPRAEGRSLAFDAVEQTARLAACLPPDKPGGLSDAEPNPEIVAALPVLGTAADEPRGLVARPEVTGVVLRSTVHELRSARPRVVLFVSEGTGPLDPRDRVGCATARRDRAAHLTKDRPKAVRRAALDRLAQLGDTLPGLQTLHVLTGNGGTGIPLAPGAEVPRGLLGSSRALSGRGTYTLLGRPGIKRVTVRPKHGKTFQVTAEDDFYVVTLPPRAGPTRLVEHAADGSVMARRRLR